MSKIPEARDMLADLHARLLEMGAHDCAYIVEQVMPLLYRRPYARPASPARSIVVDASLTMRIRAYAHANPDKSQQDIAEHFGTNHGRVSEALQGDR